MAMKATRYPWHALAESLAALPTMQIVERVREAYPDVRRTQIDGHLQRYRHSRIVGDNPAAAEWEDRRDRAAEDLRRRAEVYDWLRPVELPAPETPVTTCDPSNFTFVIGDMHFPEHDEATLAIFLRAVSILKPRRVILNGDTVDLLSVSKYPKDARARFNWKLRDEVYAFHSFLRDLHAIGNAWDMEVVETDSNHAGNGTGGRWWRYLSDRCPELLGHDDAEANLSYQKWFYPTWSPITLVDSVVIADDLLVLHGDMVRTHGGYSARGHAEKWQSSTLNNHTHRSGSSMKRIPAVGSRLEGLRRAYEIGCACNLSPVYASAPDWANGWGIVSHDDTSYAVELVQVVNGRANIAAIGASVGA